MPDLVTPTIMAQAPTDLTIGTFWDMIYTNQVNWMIMLCNFTENGVIFQSIFFIRFLFSIEFKSKRSEKKFRRMKNGFC